MKPSALFFECETVFVLKGFERGLRGNSGAFAVDLNQAITNIIEGDISNSVAIHNPARTGALRVTANNRRAELPATRAKHYHAKTTYTMNYTYITLYILSIIASLVYIGVRIYYIAQGVLRLQIPFNQPVVDVSTCADINSPNCSSEFCGANPRVCSVVDAGVLLAQDGVTLESGNNVIEPDLVNDPKYKGIKELLDAFTYSYWWSIVVLAAEIGGFILVHLSQQMFIRQDTKFFEMAPERVNQLREVKFIALGFLLIISRSCCVQPVFTGRSFFVNCMSTFDSILAVWSWRAECICFSIFERMLSTLPSHYVSQLTSGLLYGRKGFILCADNCPQRTLAKNQRHGMHVQRASGNRQVVCGVSTRE
jgi:hypothetical protein